MNFKNLGFFKNSDDNITVFESKNEKLVVYNYDILMEGIKWSLKATKIILNKGVYRFEKDNNYILFKTRNGFNYLFEIKKK